MARQFNQFIKNRYQQTWHTIEFSNNRHTRHHPNQRSGSLRSNFSNLPDPAKLCKSAFPRFPLHRKAPAPSAAHQSARHFPGCSKKGVGRYFSASAAATRKTLHAPEGPRKSSHHGLLHACTAAIFLHPGPPLGVPSYAATKPPTVLLGNSDHGR